MSTEVRCWCSPAPGISRACDVMRCVVKQKKKQKFSQEQNSGPLHCLHMCAEFKAANSSSGRAMHGTCSRHLCAAELHPVLFVIGQWSSMSSNIFDSTESLNSRSIWLRGSRKFSSNLKSPGGDRIYGWNGSAETKGKEKRKEKERNKGGNCRVQKQAFCFFGLVSCPCPPCPLPLALKSRHQSVLVATPSSLASLAIHAVRYLVLVPVSPLPCIYCSMLGKKLAEQ